MQRLGLEFTGSELIAKVRELVALHPTTRYEKPDPNGTGRDYPWCSYLRGTSTNDITMPGCLFGQILPLEVIDLDPRIGIVELVSDSEGDGFDVVLTVEQEAWVQDVQGNQDRGQSWQEAVEAADADYPQD